MPATAQPKKPTIPVPEPAAAPAPAVDITAEANKNISKSRTASVLRPFKYTADFIGGTFQEGLNGMANWGRKGLKVGIVLGVVAGIFTAGLAAGGLSAFLMVAAGGLALGAAGGTLKGALTGGMHAVGRDYRAHKYADDLIQRKNIQDHAPANTHDYRAAYRRQQQALSYNTQQLITRTNENTRDFNTYWQDREADRRDRGYQEKGLGF